MTIKRYRIGNKDCHGDTPMEYPSRLTDGTDIKSKFRKDTLMNNKKLFSVLAAFTAAVIVSAKIISKKHREDYRSKDIFVFGDEETIKQAEEYKKAIFEVLNEECLCCFDDFAAALSEYYGITAKCYDGKTVEYSSDKYPVFLTSEDVIRKSDNTEIRLESMSDLEDCFLYIKTDSADKPQERYSPFYYGKCWHKQTPIMLNRRNLSISTNHLLCGLAGTGKTSLMEHEIKSALFHTNDRVFVITATNEYNAIADGYDGVIEIDKENKPIYISDDQRLVVCSLEKVRYEVQTQHLSQSASIEEIRYAVQSQPLLNQSVLPEYYLKCLETIWEYVCNNVNSERLSWIFIDDIQDIMCDKRCMSLLTDIIKEAITHGCTVTLAIQRLYNLSENDIGKSLLENINLLTLFTLGVADKEFILNYFKDILSEADALFLEQLCYKRQCGTGLYIINNRLIDDNNYGNLTAIPFEIKL